MGIPSTIRTGAEKLFTRLERPGKIVAGEQFQELRDHPGANVPAWLIELMAEFPFAGIEIGVKVTDAFAGFEDEPVMFEWGDAALMKEINTQAIPACTCSRTVTSHWDAGLSGPATSSSWQQIPRTLRY